MKKLFAVIFMLTFIGTASFAFQNFEKCDVQMYKSSDTSTDEPDQPYIGSRLPIKRITCHIDFGALTVDFSPIPNEDPIAYEIWTEDMSFCFFTTDSASEFVEELKSCNSNRILIVGFTDFNLVGTLYVD